MIFRQSANQFTVGLICLLLALPSITQAQTSDFQIDVPLFFLQNQGSQQGALRIINHSAQPGSVAISSIDDEGNQSGSATIHLAKHEAILLYADELLSGSDRVDLESPITPVPFSRLRFNSDIKIEALSYLINNEGLLTVLNTTLLSESGCWRIPLFLSKGQLTTSFLRIMNVSDKPTDIEISARDDLGYIAPRNVAFTLASNSSTWITSEELEDGTDLFEGAIGGGSGEWQLALRSTQPTMVMHLLRGSEENWTNLSSRRSNVRGQCWLGPSLAHADQSIAPLLQPYIDSGTTPGLYAAIIDENGVKSIAATGVKKYGSTVRTNIYDRLHVGSIAKAMTTTMIATLVEEGVLANGWYTTIEHVFPELRGQIHSDYHEVTILDLLKHESGVPREANDWEAYADLSISERRREIMIDNLSSSPGSDRGYFAYSHFGYLVAASMVEQLTGESWESLIQSRLFDPLGMSNSGFGPPGTTGSEDEPWGHRRDGRDWEPTQSDRPQTYAPAGGIHVTIEDWAKFIQLWLPNADPRILSRESIDRILILGNQQTVVGGAVNVAGWFLYPGLWGHGIALNHVGSNGRWHAQIWILRDTNRAYLAVANSTDLIDGSLSQRTLPMLNNLVETLVKVNTDLTPYQSQITHVIAQ